MMTYHYGQLIDFLDWEVDLAKHIILTSSLDKHRKPVKNGIGMLGKEHNQTILGLWVRKVTC